MDEEPARAHPAQLHVERRYGPRDFPEVLVHIGGDWYLGEVHQWSTDPDGEWWADITWHRPMGQTFTGTFPRQRVWEDWDRTQP